jgi:hypothetical protein
MFSAPFGDISSLFAAAANLPNNAPALSAQAPSAPPAAQPQPQTTDLTAATVDLLGQSSISDMASTTVEAASAGMAALYSELDDIPLSEKAALLYAQQTKPELVNDEEVFKFLLGENFKAPVSHRCASDDYLLHDLSHRRSHMILAMRTGSSPPTRPLLERTLPALWPRQVLPPSDSQGGVEG